MVYRIPVSYGGGRILNISLAIMGISDLNSPLYNEFQPLYVYIVITVLFCFLGVF